MYNVPTRIFMYLRNREMWSRGKFASRPFLGIEQSEGPIYINRYGDTFYRL